MFHTKLKEKLGQIPNKTNFMKDIGLKPSYLGIRYFLAGKQEKIGSKGLEKILEKMGYELKLVPVKKDSEAKAKAEELQNIFFEDLDEYLKKFENDEARTPQIRINPEESSTAIEENLQNLDTSKPIEVDGQAIDMGIDINDLFD